MLSTGAKNPSNKHTSKGLDSLFYSNKHFKINWLNICIWVELLQITGSIQHKSKFVWQNWKNAPKKTNYRSTCMLEYNLSVCFNIISVSRVIYNSSRMYAHLKWFVCVFIYALSRNTSVYIILITNQTKPKKIKPQTFFFFFTIFSVILALLR